MCLWFPQLFNKHLLSSERSQPVVLALGSQPGCALTGKVEESGAEGSPRSRRNTGKAQVVPETVASEQGDQQSSRERRKDREWGKVEAAMMPHPVIPPTHTHTHSEDI